MIITFVNSELRKYANNNRLAIRKIGMKRANVFQQRLEDIMDSASFADFEHLPGRFHQLREDRKDQWACDLDHPYRLIFQPGVIPIPKDRDGKQILNEITSVQIIEINNYHKKG